MSDLISRQAAIDMLKNRWKKTRNYEGIGDDIAEECELYLKQVPSAQPELIRCKDCKYSEHWYKDKTRCFLWHETGIDVFEDGYCNYAKRHTDADMRGEQDE